MNLIKKKIKAIFFKMDGKKEVLNTFNIKLMGGCFLLLFFLVEAFSKKDLTSVSKSSTQFIDTQENEGGKTKSLSARANEVINTHEANSQANERSRQTGRSKRPLVPQDVNFNAKQVITRSGLSGSLRPLPSGTNIIGELLNGIDTRNQNQIIKVKLPYGARHRSGGTIPKNTVLLGTVRYSGQGEKVFISFNRVILPEGQEYKINAQALNSKDYSPGLIGEFHGNADLRMMATMGLTMVSAASDVLTTRSSMGGIDQNGQQTVVPDATMNNAMLQGVSKVTEQEATRQAQEMQQKKEYVTVEAGSDLIISLISPFRGEKFN